MESESEGERPKPPIAEGEDFYFESGLMVLTSTYLLKRGFCCKSGCRHCPYGFDRSKQENVDI